MTPVNSLKDHGGSGYDPDAYWQETEDSYPHYPTVRHRKRFIVSQLNKLKRTKPNFSVFDFGCGEGTLLKHIQEKFNLAPNQVGGCDISKQAVLRAREKMPESEFQHDFTANLSHPYDVMICSEVLEHTTKYSEILAWMASNLSSGGLMIVTTQAGRRHASDHYTGHTQHFKISELKTLMSSLGLTITTCRLWGWPLFTLQKYLTNFRFQTIQRNYLEGKLTLRKRAVFKLAYLAYFLHDLIPFGPQIYIVGRKN